MNNSIDNLNKMLSKFSSRLVIYEDFKAAIAGILECVENTKYANESENLIVVANPGCGKTTLTKVIRKKMPAYVVKENAFEVTITPVVYAEVPAKATRKSLAKTLLQALGAPPPYLGTEIDLTNRVIETFRRCKVVLVLLDEFHNLIDVTNRKAAANAETTSWLRQLINKGGTSYALLGTPGYLDVLSDSNELDRRFEHIFELKNLYASDPESKSEPPGTLNLFFKNISNSIKSIFEFESLPSWKDNHFMDQLYSASSGIPDAIIKLSKEAVRHAFMNNSLQLDATHFAHAWDKGKGRSARLTLSNPFRMNALTLASCERRSK